MRRKTEETKKNNDTTDAVVGSHNSNSLNKRPI